MSSSDMLPIAIFLFCIFMQINSMRQDLKRIADALDKDRERIDEALK